jgi:hypothetical protein
MDRKEAKLADVQQLQEVKQPTSVDAIEQRVRRFTKEMFVKPITDEDEVFCPNCCNIMWQPYEHNCGKLFCLTCKDNIMTTQKQNPKCPYCNESITNGHVSNRARIKITNMEVKCCNKDCIVTKPLLTMIQTHLDGECDYESRKCEHCNKDFPHAKAYAEHRYPCLLAHYKTIQADYTVALTTQQSLQQQLLTDANKHKELVAQMEGRVKQLQEALYKAESTALARVAQMESTMQELRAKFRDEERKAQNFYKSYISMLNGNGMHIHVIAKLTSQLIVLDKSLQASKVPNRDYLQGKRDIIDEIVRQYSGD